MGLGEPDDAAVYRLDDARALIQTTDFFTPIVDDPWIYGAIAAANAMSDVYAMGGEVLLALNIAGFPEEVEDTVVAQVFGGGAAKVREAGGVVAGGHTVTNPEPFYGLSVTGLVHPERIMRKGGARPGERLFLTKPLGTGIITTAAKLTGPAESRAHRMARRAQGKPDLDPAHLEAAVISMTRLSRDAARAAQEAGVQGATDVTGFGLLGHAAEMALASHRESGAGLVIRAEDVPRLPGTMAYIRAGYLTRGHQRNPEHYGRWVHFAQDVSPELRILLWEAETSGGLLVSVPPDRVEVFREACAQRTQACWEIGEVIEGKGVQVI